MSALDRDALYYPYIEIKSVNWLKATLLCFPQVRRIIPSGYVRPDNEAIRPFLAVNGARGQPLLADEYPYTRSCEAEQARLAKLIFNNLATFQRLFSKKAAQQKYPATWNGYQIRNLKLSGELREVLLNSHLAWEAFTDGYDKVYGLHPRLGRAVMATIAIAIANDQGLDIVTSDASVHRSVCTQEQKDVFEELLGSPRLQPPHTSAETVDELAAVFMTTYLDVSKLSAEQIAELQKDGKDLRRFKDAILPIAEQLPDIPNSSERHRRLKDAAGEINNEWKSYRRSLPRFAMDAILDATEAKLPAAVSTALGTATFLPFGIVAGVAIGLTTYAGWKMWSKYKKDAASPYQYLNRIHRAGATLVVPTSVKAR